MSLTSLEDFLFHVFCTIIALGFIVLIVLHTPRVFHIISDYVEQPVETVQETEGCEMEGD